MPAVVHVPTFRVTPRDPQLSLAGSLDVARNRSVPLILSSVDYVTGHGNVAEMKVWGDIDPGFHPEWFASSEGAARWIPFAALTTLVLSAGDGTKTVSARIRNASEVQSDVMTDSVDLVADPHVTVLWKDSVRTPSMDAEVRFGWSTSHDFTARSIRIAQFDDAHFESCVEVSSGGGGTAGAHQWQIVPMSDILAADIYPTQSGRKTVKVFVQVDGVWVS